MAIILAADLLPILDSMGLADVARLALADTTEGGDIADSADNAVADVLALTDIAQAAGLANGVRLYQVAAAAPYTTREALFSSVLAAIKTHLVVPLNTYLNTNTAKVSRSFATLFRSLYGAAQLLPAYVFEDSHVVARTGAITGASTVTNTAGTDLDITLVAPSQYEVHCTVDIAGASTPTVHLTMKKLDGTFEIKDVALTDTFDAGEDIDVGLATDVYIGCTLITVTTGGASGTFQVRNKWPRTPVL